VYDLQLGAGRPPQIEPAADPLDSVLSPLRPLTETEAEAGIPPPFPPSSLLALTPDGKAVVAEGHDSTPQLWSFPEGQLLRTLHEPAVPGSGLRRTLHRLGHATLTAQLSKDGRILVTGSIRQRVDVWDLVAGELVRRVEGQASGSLCLGGSCERPVLVSGGGLGGDPSQVVIRDLPDGEVRRLPGHRGAISCLDLSPDERLLASGSTDGTVRLWGFPEGRLLQVLEHGREVQCLAFSPDGQLLATGGKDRFVRVWGLDLLYLASTPPGKLPPQGIEQIETMLSDGRQLAAGERALLEYTAALVRWRRRHDITLDTARRIEIGPVDVVLDG
jgi:WD40 repeat protein